MIKVTKYSKQKIDNNDIVIGTDYIHTVKWFGIKLYENKQESETNLEEGYGKGTKVGFGKK